MAMRQENLSKQMNQSQNADQVKDSFVNDISKNVDDILSGSGSSRDNCSECVAINIENLDNQDSEDGSSNPIQKPDLNSSILSNSNTRYNDSAYDNAEIQVLIR